MPAPTRPTGTAESVANLPSFAACAMTVGGEIRMS
jgi:hypothetical protein